MATEIVERSLIRRGWVQPTRICRRLITEGAPARLASQRWRDKEEAPETGGLWGFFGFLGGTE